MVLTLSFLDNLEHHKAIMHCLEDREGEENVEVGGENSF